MRHRINPRVLIYSTAIGIVPLSIITAPLWPDELAPNIIADAISVCFTIFILDNLIRYQEQHRTFPARYAAFKDVRLIYGRFVALWSEIIRAAFIPALHKLQIEAAKDGVFSPSLGDVVAMLNLDSNANVIPRNTWRNHLFNEVIDLENRLNRCLERYALYMEPEMISALQNFERMQFLMMAKLVQVMPEADAEIGVKRGPLLGWGHSGMAAESLKHARRVGQLLEKMRPEFSSLPDTPATIDTEFMDLINDLRTKG